MKTKSQGTSKAGEMDWEKEFDENISPYITDYGGISEDPELENMIKDFIHTAIQQAIAQERERIAKQLKMTVLFNDKAMYDGDEDELREKIVAFIRYELMHYHQQP